MGFFQKIAKSYRDTVRQGEEIHRRIVLDVMSIDEALAWHEMTPGQRHKFEMSFLKEFKKNPVEFARLHPSFFPFVPDHLKDQVYGE
jgi:hypothetical protein